MTDAIVVAAIVAVPPTLAAVLGWLATRKRNITIEGKVDQVHAIANDRLTKALDEITALRLLLERQRVTISNQEAGHSERPATGEVL